MNVHDLAFFLIKRGGPWDVTRLAYVSAGKVEYIGVAPRGSATSAALWQVFRLTYSGNDVVAIESSLKEQIWDNRVSLAYG